MSIDLYQVCEMCKGTGERPDLAWSRHPACPSCGGRKFCAIGLTLAQVDRYVFEAHHSYRADGTAERLNSAGEVKRRRIAAAAEVAGLRIKVSAAVSVLTGLADRLGVNDEDLAGMLADAQIRAEDDRDVH